MVEINSKDYRDYYIKDGVLIGEIEQMYQNIDDPWDIGDANDLAYNITLGVLESFCKSNYKLLDLGCGKGIFTRRVKERCQCGTIGADVSKTACEKANKAFPDIAFVEYDLLQFEKCPFEEEQFDIVLLSKVLWGLIPRLPEMLRFIPKLLKRGGYLIISQHLFRPNSSKQTYGNSVLSTIDDLEKMIVLKKELCVEFTQGIEPYYIIVYEKEK